MFCGAHVFERTWIVLGGEEIVAVFGAESFDDVFEGVGVGPTDANGFLGESEDLSFALVERAFCANPRDLIREEIGADERFGVDVNERIYGAHNGFLNFGWGKGPGTTISYLRFEISKRKGKRLKPLTSDGVGTPC